MATIRQETAFKEVLKGSTISKAMKTAGYSETTSTTTGKLTNTKGWQELKEKVISDKLLAKKHREMLNKTERVLIGKELVDTGQPHSDVNRAIEMGYKIKGYYAEQQNNNQIIIVNISGEGVKKYGVETKPESQ